MNRESNPRKIIFVDFDNTLSANKWSDVVEETSFSQDDYVNWDCICKTNQNTQTAATAIAYCNKNYLYNYTNDTTITQRPRLLGLHLQDKSKHL